VVIFFQCIVWLSFFNVISSFEIDSLGSTLSLPKSEISWKIIGHAMLMTQSQSSQFRIRGDTVSLIQIFWDWRRFFLALKRNISFQRQKCCTTSNNLPKNQTQSQSEAFILSYSTLKPSLEQMALNGPQLWSKNSKACSWEVESFLAFKKHT